MINPVRLDCFDSRLNVVVAERVDPLLSLVGRDLTLASQLGVAACGILLLLRALGGSWFQSILGTVQLLFLIVLTSGWTASAWMGCWFPWLLLSATICLRTPKWEWLTLSLYGVMLALWLYTGGVRGSFGLVVLALWILSRGAATFDRAQMRCLSLAAISVMLAILLVPHPNLFDYPSDARLVPLSPLFFYRSVPYLGAGYEFVSTEYEAFLSSLERLLSGTLLGILCCLMLLVRFRRVGRSEARPFLWSMLAVCFLCSEALLPAQYRLWTGFEVLRRLLPGMSYLPSPAYLSLPLCVAIFSSLLGVSFIGLSSAASGEPRRGNLLMLMLTVILGIIAIPGVLIFGSSIFGVSGVQQIDFSLLSAECLTPHSSYAERLQKSPSAFLLKHKHYLLTSHDDVKDLREIERREFTRLSQGITVAASVRADELSKMMDGDLQTAWSTQRPQEVGDRVQIFLNEVRMVDRIVLRLGKFSSDFPRGVAVRVRGPGGERLVVDEPKWLGPILFTAQGLPYFGPEQRVTLDLAKPILAKEIDLSLTASDPTYSWSIAELELYSPGVE